MNAARTLVMLVHRKRARQTLVRQATTASPTIPRIQLPQGACLAWKRGTSGEEQRHGESRRGSSPDFLFTAGVLAVLFPPLRARGAGTARPCVCAFSCSLFSAPLSTRSESHGRAVGFF